MPVILSIFQLPNFFTDLVERYIPKEPISKLGLHIAQKGEIIPLSAKFSPAMRKVQYIIKNTKLILIPTANPPFFAKIPKGAPTSIKTMQAKGMEYFF